MTSEARAAVDGATLIGEIRRYLAAVDAFREQGHEPHWRLEPKTKEEVRCSCGTHSSLPARRS